MFELINHPIKLLSVNARAEMHGEERVAAFDLKLEASCSSDVIIHFHPELRQMLYKKNESPDLIEQIDPEELTELRFPKMGIIRWDWEGIGYSVRVSYGIGGESDIRMGDCKINDFRFLPNPGGTVSVIFRVIAHPKTDDVGRLCELIQQTVEMDVTPPEPTTVQELFGD